ncbi:Replication factor A protein [Trema orientale]|uniref:Replication factor A protein n=1 Tax=Trema orientale TaxID=63057 RepID=A0A2P5ACC1_TREOI|nr:Replication factor A protein [Trema orientale]
MGTRVQATIFDDDIECLENTLTVFKTYNISKAIVTRILPIHRIVDNEYQWTINAKTEVHEVAMEEAINYAQDPLHFAFVPFSALDQYKHRTAEVDILALAIDIQPPKYVSTSSGRSCVQEITLVNEEKIQMLLTVWDALFEEECSKIATKIRSRPILAAKRLRVVSYHNTSLCTRASSRLLIDPDLPEAIALRTWSDENETYLQMCLTERIYLPSSSKIAMPMKESITPINIVKDLTGKVQCKDPSGMLPATIFGNIAEKLLHCTAIDLMKNIMEDSIQNLESIADVSSCKEYTAYIKTYKYEYREQTKYKYTIMHLFEESDGNT